MLEDPDHYVKVVAPMVRYSKLPFRVLCRRWGADVVFTPMIMAKDFAQSYRARNIEFRTSDGDEDAPLVVQFAANNGKDLADAAEYLHGHVQAVDINCGCPQGWVIKEQLGAGILRSPETIRDMVRAVRERAGMVCSIKIRVDDDMRRTVDLVRMAEAAGVAWVTVHGRTTAQRANVPADMERIRIVKDALSVPVIANGDVLTPADVERTARESGTDGCMSARGILANPALFAGHEHAPWECIYDFADIALRYTLTQALFHQHICYMTRNRLSRPDFLRLQNCRSAVELLTELDEMSPVPIYNAMSSPSLSTPSPLSAAIDAASVSSFVDA